MLWTFTFYRSSNYHKPRLTVCKRRWVGLFSTLEKDKTLLQEVGLWMTFWITFINGDSKKIGVVKLILIKTKNGFPLCQSWWWNRNWTVSSQRQKANLNLSLDSWDYCTKFNYLFSVYHGSRPHLAKPSRAKLQLLL